MQLSLPEESVPVKVPFERFFAAESTTRRLRAAERRLGLPRSRSKER